jgi:predicted transposase YbfD/YdcC
MNQDPTALIEKHFSTLEDPRASNAWHKLFDILVIAFCAVICGADSWVEVEVYGESKLKWLQTYLELPHGIPTHHTFGRVFRRLDPEQFQACFLAWIQAVAEITSGQVIAIDGKKLRRSYDKSANQAAIHMVSAWATENQLVLGQQKVEAKSNEITAIPELLRVLALKGCVVTIDAIGCQREYTQQIVEQGADYVLALKENQGRLYEDVTGYFAYTEQIQYRRVVSDHHKTVNKGHGRIEIRECWVISDPAYIQTIRSVEQWTGLTSIAKVVSERRAEQTSVETRYFISSLGNDAQQMLSVVRNHWQIENGLHWVLDMAFREDECRVRKGYGAQNLAVIRHAALNLLKQEKTAKCGVKAKRFKAACDNDYLLRVLAGLGS